MCLCVVSLKGPDHDRSKRQISILALKQNEARQPQIPTGISGHSLQDYNMSAQRNRGSQFDGVVTPAKVPSFCSSCNCSKLVVITPNHMSSL